PLSQGRHFLECSSTLGNGIAKGAIPDGPRVLVSLCAVKGHRIGQTGYSRLRKTFS
ncbi:hypothetical protein AAFF_G00073670, partial [Aldrovandia affinis]